MSLQNLTLFPRLELIGAPTPLEYLPRLSDYLGREIFIKRDDVTPLAMGGNKLRKLEFLAADAPARRGGYPDYRRSYPVQPCAPDGGGGG
ncbi:D-cysteine desulfhydrase [Klebsiella michiganensis]|nr:D-cysteine desulfhydrase [Klebsiella michiganensis]